jgi:hypothetical protein
MKCCRQLSLFPLLCAGALSAAWAVVALAACQSATAIVVDVATDVPCSDGTRVQTTLAVGDVANVAERPPSATVTRCDPATGRIGSLVVVPSGDDNAEVAIRVVTGVGRDPASCVDSAGSEPQGCIVALRALRFIPHQVIDLPIEMSESCSGVFCPVGETCSQGECVDDSSAAPPPQAAKKDGGPGKGNGNGQNG